MSLQYVCTVGLLGLSILVSSIQIQGVLFWGVKLLGCEAVCSPPSVRDVNQGRRERARVPMEKTDGLKTVSCRVTCAWSERVHLYSPQIMILSRNKESHTQLCRAPRPGNLCRRFPSPFSSAPRL